MEDDVLDINLSDSDASAAEENWEAQQEKAKKKKEGDFPTPPPGYKYVISYDNVMAMARINHIKEEKF